MSIVAKPSNILSIINPGLIQAIVRGLSISRERSTRIDREIRIIRQAVRLFRIQSYRYRKYHDRLPNEQIVICYYDKIIMIELFLTHSLDRFLHSTAIPIFHAYISTPHRSGWNLTTHDKSDRNTERYPPMLSGRPSATGDNACMGRCDGFAQRMDSLKDRTILLRSNRINHLGRSSNDPDFILSIVHDLEAGVASERENPC